MTPANIGEQPRLHSIDNPVAQRFSNAAGSYQQHNVVQRQTQQQLFSLFAEANITAPQRVLDVGAGPGTDFGGLVGKAAVEPKNIDQSAIPKVIAVDIAAGMLQQLKQQFTGYHTICADAQQLPLASNSIDCYYSNLALQWCESMSQVAAEAQRVLAENGELLIAVVVADSLPELAQLGLSSRRFIDECTLYQTFAQYPWQTLTCHTVEHQCYFADLRTLLYSIKGVGASVGATGKGLRGKQHWLHLQAQAEALRQTEGLPLTYRVAYVRARK